MQRKPALFGLNLEVRRRGVDFQVELLHVDHEDTKRRLFRKTTGFRQESLAGELPIPWSHPHILNTPTDDVSRAKLKSVTDVRILGCFTELDP